MVFCIFLFSGFGQALMQFAKVCSVEIITQTLLLLLCITVLLPCYLYIDPLHLLLLSRTFINQSALCVFGEENHLLFFLTCFQECMKTMSFPAINIDFYICTTTNHYYYTHKSLKPHKLKLYKRHNLL